MGKILCAVIAVVVSVVAVNSLQCNQCKYGLLGFCLSNSVVNCSTNTSVCFTRKTTFTSISSSLGFNSQGCTEPANCNNINGTLLGVDYQSSVACCSTDKCNPTTISGAPATKMTFAGLIAAATLASVWANLI